MSSFIAIDPAQPTQLPTDILSSGAFWPEINPADVREVMRIDSTITPARLKNALIDAMFSCNHELKSWQEMQINAGYIKLEQIPAQLVNDTHRLAFLYSRAVYCKAKCNLLERTNDLDTSHTGNKKAKELEPQIDDHARDARWAIRDLLGIGHATVELL